MSIHFVVATSACLQSTYSNFEISNAEIKTYITSRFIHLTFEYFHKIRGNVTEKSEVKDVIYSMVKAIIYDT